MRKEFGSDFHSIDMNSMIADTGSLSLRDYYSSKNEYACGRHAIDAIVAFKGWKRIWIPAFFCYEVIGHIKSTGMEVVLYDDNPLAQNDEEIVRKLSYREGDVLLRVNYFGLRDWRSNKGIEVPVIEDHTHALISEWALNSDADYCIASIRKSLPVAAGGIMWSPKGLELPEGLVATKACEEMAAVRYEAMLMKHDYLLQQKPVKKEFFRAKFLASEDMIDKLRLSGIDKESSEIASNINIIQWTELRTRNWSRAYEQLRKSFTILEPSGDKHCQSPFSLIILCESVDERAALIAHLIKNEVYPAVLWSMPKDSPFTDALSISQRILSLHVDGRYSMKDIDEICERIALFRKN